MHGRRSNNGKRIHALLALYAYAVIKDIAQIIAVLGVWSAVLERFHGVILAPDAKRQRMLESAPMEIPIRRVDKELPLPEYKTPGAAAMDCSVRDDVTISPRSIGYAHLNFALKPPAGHFVMMAARSSLHKRGLLMANGVAIFDEDYSGDEDEYKVIFYNFTDESIDIKRGERVTQIFVMPFDRVQWSEVDTLGGPSRGGMGTTGL